MKRTLSKHCTTDMSFEQKSCYRSLKNDFGANNRDHENEGEMSFKLIHKYLNQKFDERNKKLESEVRQIEKKLKLSKPEQEIEFKFKVYEIQHWCNIKLVKELEKRFCGI